MVRREKRGQMDFLVKNNSHVWKKMVTMDNKKIANLKRSPLFGNPATIMDLMALIWHQSDHLVKRYSLLSYDVQLKVVFTRGSKYDEGA